MRLSGQKGLPVQFVGHLHPIESDREREREREKGEWKVRERLILPVGRSVIFIQLFSMNGTKVPVLEKPGPLDVIGNDISHYLKEGTNASQVSPPSFRFIT